jgi:hypothetical protein
MRNIKYLSGKIGQPMFRARAFPAPLEPADLSELLLGIPEAVVPSTIIVKMGLGITSAPLKAKAFCVGRLTGRLRR